MVEHYLVSIPLEGGYFHGYVMTDDHAQVYAAADRMLKVAEEKGFPMFMPVILETRLDTGREIVREIVVRNMPEAAQTIAGATNYHFTAWVMSGDHPDNATLLELH